MDEAENKQGTELTLGESNNEGSKCREDSPPTTNLDESMASACLPCNELYVEILASDVTKAETVVTAKKSKAENLKNKHFKSKQWSWRKKRGTIKSEKAPAKSCLATDPIDNEQSEHTKKTTGNVEKESSDGNEPINEENEDERNSEDEIDDDKNCVEDEGIHSLIDVDKEYNLRVNVAKNNEGSYQCFKCAKIFRTFPELCDHLFEHDSRSTPRMCEKCGTGFMSKQQLDIHNSRRLRFPQEMPYECITCDKGFTTEYLLKFHMESHKTEQVLECLKCNQGFDCGSSLLNHTHNGICQPKSMTTKMPSAKNWVWKPAHSRSSPGCFICNSCKLIFHSASDLFIHMQTHGQGETFICMSCGYGYNGWTTQEIAEHKKSHETRSPNEVTQCDVCDRFFTQVDLLVLHKKTHYGLSNYECHVCHERYKDGYELLDHLKDPKVKCILPEVEKIQNSNEIDTGSKDRQNQMKEVQTAGKIIQQQTEDVLTTTQDNQSERTLSESSKLNMCKIAVGNEFCCITRPKYVKDYDETSDDNEDKVQDYYGRTRDNNDDDVQDYGSVYSCLSLYLMTEEKFVYKCESCNQTYKTYWHLYYHLSKQHDFKTIQICKSCGLGIETMKAFLSHKLRHHEENEELMYECSLCAERFIHSTLLTFHNQVIHQGRELLYCERCDVGFRERKLFIKHYEKHHGKISGNNKHVGKKYRSIYNIYNCMGCSYRCKDENTLKIHTRHMHRNECHPCKKKFTTSELYMSHIKTHYEDYPYKCGLCGNNYSDIKDLVHHINIHKMKEKGWYVCTICKKQFLDKENFEAHHKVHECSLCGLTIKKNKRAHMTLCRLHKTCIYTCACPYCGRGFKSFGRYKQHVRSHKPKAKYHCDVCKNSIFFNYTDQQRHFKKSSHKKRVLLSTPETDKEIDDEKEMAMNTQKTSSETEHSGGKSVKQIPDILDEESKYDDVANENSKQEIAPKFVYLEPEKSNEKFVLTPLGSQLGLDTLKPDQLDLGQSVVNLLAMTTENVDETDKIGDQAQKNMTSEDQAQKNLASGDQSDNISEPQANPIKTVVKMSNKTLANLKTYQKLMESAKKTQANLDGQSVIKLLQETKEIQENAEKIKVNVNEIMENDESETCFTEKHQAMQSQVSKTVQKLTSHRHISPKALKENSAINEKKVSSSGRKIKRPSRFLQTSDYPNKVKMAKTENEVPEMPQTSAEVSEESKYHECVQNILSAIVKVERLTDDDITKYTEKDNPDIIMEQNQAKIIEHPDVNSSFPSTRKDSATKLKKTRIGPRFIMEKNKANLIEHPDVNSSFPSTRKDSATKLKKTRIGPRFIMEKNKANLIEHSDVNSSFPSTRKDSATKLKKTRIGPRFIMEKNKANLIEHSDVNSSFPSTRRKSEEIKHFAFRNVAETQELVAMESSDSHFATEKQDAHFNDNPDNYDRKVISDKLKESPPNKRVERKQAKAMKEPPGSPKRKSDRKRSSTLRLSNRKKSSTLRLKMSKECGYDSVGVKRKKIKQSIKIETNDDAEFEKCIENIETDIEKQRQDSSPKANTTVNKNNDKSNSDKSKLLLKSIIEKRREQELLNIIDGTKGNIYQCSDCDARFSNYRYFYLHTSSYHRGSSVFLCLTCGYGKGCHISEVGKLQTLHEKEHKCNESDFPFHCNLRNCTRYFKCKELLDLHVLFDHKKAFNTCDICDKQILYFNIFVDHYKLCFKRRYGHILTGEIDGTDTIQHKPRNSNNSGLEIYWYLKVRSNSMFNCGVCREGFWKIEEFYFHLYLHADEHHTTPFICMNCGYGTVGNRNHGKRHNGKPLAFRCKIGKCKEAFLKPELLVFHERIHAADYDDRYQCFLCSLKYGSLTELMNHFPVCKNIEENINETNTVCQDNSNGENEIIQGIENKAKPDQLTGRNKGNFETPEGESIQIDSNVMKTMQDEIKREKLLDLMKEIYTLKELRSFGFITDESKQVQKDGVFFCEVCEDKFDDYSDFYEHLQKHSGNRASICMSCGRGKNCRLHEQPKWLAKHNSPHQDQNFSCDLCESKFVKQELLNIHQKQHQGKGLLFCKTCGRDFQVGTHYLIHKCTKQRLLLSASDTNKEKNGTIASVNNKSNSQFCKPTNLISQTKDKKPSFDALPSAIEVKFTIHEKRHLQRQKMLKLKHKFDHARKLLDAARKKTPPVKETGIKCFVCHRFFKYRSYLCEHGRMFEYPKAHICKLCGRICKRKEALQTHIQRMHSKKFLRCQICNRAFGMPRDLHDHIKHVHKIKQETNAQEGATPDHNYMNFVNTNGTKEQKFQLVTYSENATLDSSQPDDYKKFILQQDGKNICKICGIIFASPKIYRAKDHILIHLGEKTKVCSICNYSCVFSKQLKSHMLFCHSESQKCKFCDKILKSKRSLELHIKRNHKDLYVPELKYSCNFCGHRFVSATKCYIHKRLYHSDVKYSCNVCGQSLASARGLKKHLERVHNIKSVEKSLPTALSVIQDVQKECKSETEDAAAYIQQYLQTSPPKKLSKVPKNSKDNRNLSKLGKQTGNQKRVVETDNGRLEKNTSDNVENITTDEFCICDQCGQLQFNRASLNFHMKTVHERKVWTCNICAKVFTTIRDKTKHREQYHTDIKIDTVCFTESVHHQQNKLAEAKQIVQTTVQNQQKLSVANQIRETIDSSSLSIEKSTDKSTLNKEHSISESDEKNDSEGPKYEEDISRYSDDAEDEEMDDAGSLLGGIDTRSEQVNSSTHKTLSSSPIKRLWDTFRHFSETGKITHQVQDMKDESAENIDRVKVLSDMDDTNDGIYTATRLELSPMKKVLSMESNTSSSSLELSPMKRIERVENSTSSDANRIISHSAIVDKGTQFKVDTDNVNVETCLRKTEVSSTITETLSSEPKTPAIKMESLGSTTMMIPSMKKIPSQKDFTPSEIDIASSLLKLDSPMMPNSPASNTSKVSSSPYLLHVDNVEGTIEHEVTIETSNYENVTIDRGSYAMNFDTNEATKKKNNKKTINIQPLKLVDDKRNAEAKNSQNLGLNMEIVKSELSANEGTPSPKKQKLEIKQLLNGQEMKTEVALPADQKTGGTNLPGDSGEANLPGISTEANSLVEHKYCTSNDGKDVNFGSIEIGNNKPDIEATFDQVINVPGRLNKPYQTMIQLPDNAEEIQNTVVNLPNNVKSVDLTVANMETDDEDVYLLFFV